MILYFHTETKYFPVSTALMIRDLFCEKKLESLPHLDHWTYWHILKMIKTICFHFFYHDTFQFQEFLWSDIFWENSWNEIFSLTIEKIIGANNIWIKNHFLDDFLFLCIDKVPSSFQIFSEILSSLQCNIRLEIHVLTHPAWMKSLPLGWPMENCFWDLSLFSGLLSEMQ